MGVRYVVNLWIINFYIFLKEFELGIRIMIIIIKFILVFFCEIFKR